MKAGLLFYLLLIYTVGLYAQEPKLILPIGHTNIVRSARFSPDGKRVVTASGDNSAKIWDAASGNILADLRGHDDVIINADFSPDGKKIITASADHTAIIWDALSGKLQYTLRGHLNLVTSARFSPACVSDPKGGKKVITTSYDSTAKIWDALTGKLLLELRGHSGEVISAFFSPDGNKIVSASRDKTARTWDAFTGKLLFELNAHTGQVTYVQYSPDGNTIATTSSDGTAKLWNAITGKLLQDLKGHTQWVSHVQFSPDGKQIVTASRDNTAKIWEVATGKLVFDLLGHKDWLFTAQFSSATNGKKMIVTSSRDKTVKIWDAFTGKLIKDLQGHSTAVTSAQFSPDGNKIVSASRDNTAKIWDARSGNLIKDLTGHTGFVYSARFSPDTRRIVTATGDNTAKIWDVATGKLINVLVGHHQLVYYAEFSPTSFDDSIGGEKIVTASFDGTAQLWETRTGKLIAELPGDKDSVLVARFSPDGSKIVTTSSSGRAKIWNVSNGKLLFELIGHTGTIWDAQFTSPGPGDVQKIVTASSDGTAKIWDVNTGSLIHDLIGHKELVLSARFSGDGKKIVTASTDGSAKIWETSTGKLIADLTGHADVIHLALFSPRTREDPNGDKEIVTVSADSTAKIWDGQTGKLLHTLSGHTNLVYYAQFSPDGKLIATASHDYTSKIWNTSSGQLIADLRGHTNFVNDLQFSPVTTGNPTGGNKIITASSDGTTMIWNTRKGTLLYSFFGVDSSDYMIVDKDNHYDGTPAARKLLYYTCGTDIIELQQLKDKLWEPDLAQRINNGETIKGSKLSDLNICGLIPVVDPFKNKTGYQYKITPGRGGLGETILYVNGIETKKYQPAQLKKVGGNYELIVPRTELQKYFTAGKENQITVKAYTKENDIYSRGAEITEEDEIQDNTPPNLYAVIIGVSNYKGNELDLKYADKDARDLSNAVALSASKLLGKEHVFMYKLHTGEGHDVLPEKQSVKDIFTAIGKKAAANDILMIFFAGHGVVKGEKKHFYFLTADASISSITPTGVKDAGISTEELMEWMKPANIKAQKRILILDACNSGSAINEMVSIGKDQGYSAARDVDKAEEIKEIDRLNQKAGLYILSASASNQSAYELSRYNQGVLTYALLKAIKEHPEILEKSTFLNVTNWFNEAVKIVTGIVRETNLRQEPQQITTTNFNIGKVDNEVLARIVLPTAKPLFVASSFQNNDENIAFDDMELSGLVDKQLNEVSSRGINSDITFLDRTDSPDAYQLSGRYELKDDEIIIKVVNVKQKKEKSPSIKFEIKHKKNDLKGFSEAIVSKAMELIEKAK